MLEARKCLGTGVDGKLRDWIAHNLVVFQLIDGEVLSNRWIIGNTASCSTRKSMIYDMGVDVKTTHALFVGHGE
jgi:hypothetical protein